MGRVLTQIHDRAFPTLSQALNFLLNLQKLGQVFQKLGQGFQKFAWVFQRLGRVF